MSNNVQADIAECKEAAEHFGEKLAKLAASLTHHRSLVAQMVQSLSGPVIEHEPEGSNVTQIATQIEALSEQIAEDLASEKPGAKVAGGK